MTNLEKKTNLAYIVLIDIFDHRSGKNNKGILMKMKDKDDFIVIKYLIAF